MASRIKDISAYAPTLNGDDYFVVDGASGGTRKISASDARDTNGNLRDIPQNTQSAGYTLVNLDRGKHIKTSANVTIPAALLATGQAVSIYNDSASAITIIQGSGATLRLAGTTTTGNRTLAPYGIATAMVVDGNGSAGSTWVISGAGLT